MKKMSLAALMFGCAVCLLAAGCSKEASPAAGQAVAPSQPGTAVATVDGPKACELFSPEIAKKHMGEVKEPKENNLGLTSNCTYSSGGMPIKVLTLVVKRALTNEAAKVEADGALRMSKSLSGEEPVKVEGVGDSAFWAGGKLNQLNVFKGRDYFVLGGVMDDFGKEKAAEIMKDILSND